MLKALIVDDEVAGAALLKKLLDRYCENVNVIGIAYSVKSAADKIKAMTPDVVFLDIEMPFGSGFDLLKEIKDINIRVIFTTAHSRYALKAFRYNAIDYLLKPIDPDELMEAVKKCEERKKPESQDFKRIENLLNTMSQDNKIIKVPLHTQDGIVFYDSAQVIRIEADGNYTIIYIEGGHKVTSSRALKDYEEMLPGKEFFRIHKAHLININHINRYIKGEGGEVIMSDGSCLEVSRYKKGEFMARFNP